jgi:hypothetical protein
MSSINLLPHTPQIEFTETEISEILKISEDYSNLYKETSILQEEIQVALNRVTELTAQMESVKQQEIDLMTEIASKHDLDPKTVSNEAVNYLLNRKTI